MKNTKNKLKNKLNNKKGFTLIEVIVVLVILAIIIALAVPSVMKYIDDANNAKYLAEGRAVYVATEAELTKDYSDNKKLDFSIYSTDKATGTKTDFMSEVSEATGITVTNIDYTGTKPNAIEKYTLTFESPSGEDTKTVEVTKNGSAKVVE